MAVAVMVATPEALVTAEALDNTALAPPAGAMNDTVTPLIGLPATSFKVTWSALPNAVPTAANCGVPPEAVRVAGDPVLVREKDANEP